MLHDIDSGLLADGQRDGAAYRQHDSADRGRCQRAALNGGAVCVFACPILGQALAFVQALRHTSALKFRVNP